ncbi:Dihydropteroate synthase [Testicularia cyperi]|uniref:Dihydropteroate synthase n=1 Tax=Testicularia cyperi TaxID=1882483 RepID=A0A317XV24_9BASI|nr:Dihydropteroate synthase [Testicularia cyperi]
MNPVGTMVAPNALPDVIAVKRLEVRMTVGVDNWERVQPQPVTIDVRVHTDVSKAGQSDHLPYSIHYGVLVKQIEAHCATHSYKTLEELAEALAKLCIFVLHAPRVSLHVEKPRSLLHAAAAGVRIVRTANDYTLPDGTPLEKTSNESVNVSMLPAIKLSPNSSWALQDRATIRDLVINTIIGVNPWERESKQDVKLNLVVFSGEASSASSSGSAARALRRPHDYRTLVRSISDYVEQTSYQTVESLATSVARVALMENNLERVSVSVDKPSAIMYAASAGVEVDRTRAFFEQLDVRDASSSSATDTMASTNGSISSGTSVDQEWHMAAIALGSNVGDRAANIDAAVTELGRTDGCVVVDTSFLYETAPMYMLDQPRFLNAACRIATKLEPHALLSLTQSIEVKLGRDKTGVPDKGPRSVDLDILLYDDLEIKDAPHLVIPHPGIKEREFVLEPLKDILPGMEHPVHARTMRQLLTMLQQSPDYVPSGIRRVMPISGPVKRKQAGVTETPLWTWGRRTFVMGILNATPDSFSDGGDNLDAANAAATAAAMMASGSDVLDVGGMSTAPQAAEVSTEEETRRVVSVIRAVRSAGIDLPISVDTFRATVAKAALDAGADMINDVSGGERDPAILEVAKAYNCPYFLMHMRGDSKSMADLSAYKNDDVVAGVRKELEQRIERALQAGLHRWNIVLDPGIGFAKDGKGNVALLRDLAKLTQPVDSAAKKFVAESGRNASNTASSLLLRPNSSLAGFPTLVGVSRKRFLGTITGKSDPKQRESATAAACTAAIAGGADILRVHDVESHVDVAKTADAIFRLS